MAKVRFSLDLDCWIDGVEIEGDNYDDCYQKLLKMSLDDILSAGGYVKAEEMNDIEGEMVEEDYYEEEGEYEEGPYGFEDVKKLILGDGKPDWWLLQEIEMDYGDGKKLADWLTDQGVEVQNDPEDEDWWVDDGFHEYHWGDCYFYPYGRGSF